MSTNRAAAWGLLIPGFILFLANGLLTLHEQGGLPFAWQRRPLTAIRAVQKFGYITPLGTNWMSSHERRTPAVVLEDGVPLAEASAPHADIINLGGGRFSFWMGSVLFASSDDTDPLANGRRYEVSWPTPVSPRLVAVVRTAAAFILPLALLAAGALLSPRLRERWPGLSGAGPVAVGAAVFAAALLGNVLNYLANHRDPALAETGISILGVPFSDARFWHASGGCVARGDGLLPAWSALRPLYSIFLACFYTWTGPAYPLALFLNLALSALTAALVYRVGELAFGRRAGLLAALAFCLHPIPRTYMLVISTETLGLFLSVLSLHQLLLGLRSGSRRSFFCSGAALGLSNLTRPLTLVGLPFLLGWAFVVLRRRPLAARAALGRLALCCLGVGLTLGPWLARQWAVHGILTLSDNTGEALYAATSPEWGTWQAGVSAVVPAGPLRERYDEYMRRARANLRAEPGYYLGNVAASFGAVLRHPDLSGESLFLLTGALVGVGLAAGGGGVGRWKAALAAGLILAAAVWLPPAARPVLPLAGFVLMPWAGRDRLGGAVLIGALSAVLGMAVFGMRGDARFLSMVCWAYPLAALVAGEQLLRVIQRVTGAPVPAESVPAGPVAGPRWFLALRAAALLFFAVSGGRLAVQNSRPASAPPSAALPGPDAAGVVASLCASRPEFPPPAGALQVFRGRTVGDTYFLPSDARLPHWSRLFRTRPYDRTVFYYLIAGHHYPQVTHSGPAVVFPGRLPPECIGRDCLFVCRIDVNPRYKSSGEELGLEGVAVIPLDPSGGDPQFDRAALAAVRKPAER